MKFLAFLFFLAVSIAAPCSAFAQEDKFAIDLQSNQQFNWFLFVDADTLKNYMSYPGSTLSPLDQYVVTYRQTTSQFVIRGIQAPILLPVKYEEFWYHTGQAVGLRRYNQLPVPKDLQGALFIRPAASSQVLEHPLSAANCITRLLLEVYLNQSLLAAVLVPESAFDQIAGDLEKYNFLPVRQGITAGMKTLSFRLESYPKGKETMFYYAAAQQ